MIWAFFVIRKEKFGKIKNEYVLHESVSTKVELFTFGRVYCSSVGKIKCPVCHNKFLQFSRERGAEAEITKAVFIDSFFEGIMTETVLITR